MMITMLKFRKEHCHVFLINLLFFLLILAPAFCLKAFYSHADSRDLVLILRPTAVLTEYLTGMEFESETGAGFLSREQRVLIAPACAGVNFLIIAFCMAAFQGIFQWKTAWEKLIWTGFSLFSAFCVTVCINTVRIILSMHLYKADIYSGNWAELVTPERIHRISGAAVYFLGLYLFYLLLSLILEKQETKKWGKGLWPLCCYLAVSLGIPLINSAYIKNFREFTEHAIAVLSVSSGIWVLAVFAQSACKHLSEKIHWHRQGAKTQSFFC